MDSCHTGHQPRLCPSHTAEGCTPAGNCPATNRGCEYTPDCQIWQFEVNLNHNPHPLVNDVIIVVVRIARVSQSVLVQVLLPRVWYRGAIILQPITAQFSGITSKLQIIRCKLFNISVLVFVLFLFFYLLTVISRILLAGQFVVGPAVQIRIVTAQKAIARKPNGTHTLEQDLRCQTQVYTFSPLVAVVCVVFTGIVWFALLKQTNKQTKKSI